ncbi:MAG TPA: dockerin type I repeat-containing protein [Armatimonadota bacterium]
MLFASGLLPTALSTGNLLAAAADTTGDTQRPGRSLGGAAATNLKPGMAGGHYPESVGHFGDTLGAPRMWAQDGGNRSKQVPRDAASVPTADQFSLDATGGSIKLYADKENELHLLVRLVPTAQGLPEVGLPVEVWGPDGSQVAGGTLRIPAGGGLVDLVDVGIVAKEGDYQARFMFADKEATFVFMFLGDPKLAEPQVQASAPADGSLALTWNAVPGALGYWVQLYEVTKDPGGGSSTYMEARWSSSHGQTSWVLPAGSLKASTGYAALVYPLTLDPDASPLANGYWGSVTQVDFASGGNTTPPPPTQLPGDLDSNGKQDIRDVIAVLKMVAGLTPVTDPSVTAGDMNADGKLDIRDVVDLLHKVAGL